jgi:4-hydroxy-3-methylbut-2-en-1-yl diphosphate reductase
MWVILAQPRGLCAGVQATEIVERSLERHGTPVYVRHEIVHNRAVADSLKSKGAVFVEELDNVPAPSSANGVVQTGVIAALQRRSTGFGLFGKVYSARACELRRHRTCFMPGHRVQGVVCLRY